MLERTLEKKEKRPAVSTACLGLFSTLPWVMYIASLCQSGLQRLGRGYLLKYFGIKCYLLQFKKKSTSSGSGRTNEIAAAVLGM